MQRVTIFGIRDPMAKKKVTKRKSALEEIYGKVDGEWFRRNLARMGWSQTRYAGYLGCHKPAVTLMLQGARRMQLDEATKTAAAFGVTLDEVFRRAGIDGADSAESEATVAIRGLVGPDGGIRRGGVRSGPQRAPGLQGDLSAEAYRLDGSDSGVRAFGPMANGVIYFRPEPDGRVSGPAPECVGKLCAVGIQGREGLWLRVLKPGYRSGVWHLALMGGGIQEEDAVVLTAAPVLGIRF